MQINFQTQNSSISHRGLYNRGQTTKKTTGHANINKVAKFVYNFDYYPYIGETKEFIENEIKKNTIGRSFVLFEKDHAHQEGIYYHLNHIVVKDAISKEDTDKYLNMGYREKPCGGVEEYDEFIQTFNNEAYATMDVSELDKTAVDEVIKRENLK